MRRRLKHHSSNMTSSRIVLINAYFGKLPFWFPAFLLSCRYNPDILWYIFSDNDAPPRCPENVKFIKFDLMAFNRLASQKLAMDVNIQPSFAYKIVDSKPMYGKIFEEYLSDFDFWGYCDVDIIWGNLRKFLDQQMLENYDIITTRVGKVAGHLCVFRNIPEANLLSLNVPNLAAVVQDKELQRVDECHFSPYLQQYVKQDWRTKLAQIFSKSQPKKLRVYWEKSLTTPGKYQYIMDDNPERGFRWIKGATYNEKGEEVMYLHFHILKKESLKHINFGYMDSPEEIVVTKSQILMVK